MFVILPFEKDFYAGYYCPVDFVGHPLLDVINGEMIFPDRTAFLGKNLLADKPVIALLPGSRKQEIRLMLKVMLNLTRTFDGYQFVIAAAPSIPVDFYKEIISGFPVSIVYGQTYDLLHHAKAALVTSGTATLETALMGVPQVVCYKGSYLSYLVARQMVHVKYISLVNLVMDREIIHELVQDQLTPKELENELTAILSGPGREEILSGYSKLREKLGGHGASATTARLIIQYLTQKSVNKE
jgi:lipid-A-disaccharide synthase